MSHIPVVHSMLETSALSGVIAQRYEIGTFSSFVLHRSYVNDVYRIETAGGASFFLKVARRAWRKVEDVAWEVALQQHLRRHQVPASVPIVQRDGGRRCACSTHQRVRVPPFSMELLAVSSPGLHFYLSCTSGWVPPPPGCTTRSITSTRRRRDQAARPMRS